MKYFVCILVIIAGLSACDKKEIPTWADERYVYFTTDKEKSAVSDSTIISFFFYLEDDIQYPVEVAIAGKLLEKDIEFKVAVDEEKSNLPARLYDVPETFVFHRNRVKDTICIGLKNDPILLEQQYALTLRIISTGSLAAPGDLHGWRLLKVCDIAERPAWWVENPIEWFYLGTYSRKKYEKFMEVTGIYDLTGMDLGKVRLLTLQFQHWLDDQNPKIIDEDGNEMKTQIIG